MIKEISKENLNKHDLNILPVDIKKDFANNPFAKLLVLEENNEIIGYIYYSDIYERAEINQFEIKKEYRNKGKGDYLLKKMIDKVQKSITLEVKETNTVAINLYKKNGFKKVAIRKNYYDNIDGILMKRD